MIVSVLNQKGGAGKTTICINLARAMQLQGDNVLLVDSDPQGSARDWNTTSNGQLLNVVGLDRPTLDKDIRAVVHDYDWVFIDGAPSLSSMAVASIKASNVVLIPIQPSPYDLWASEDLVNLVNDRIEMTDGKLKAAFIISRKIPNTLLGKEIRGILEEYKLPVFINGTSQRVIYSTSAAKGSTVLDCGENDASREIKAIANELKGLVL